MLSNITIATMKYLGDYLRFRGTAMSGATNREAAYVILNYDDMASSHLNAIITPLFSASCRIRIDLCMRFNCVARCAL